MLCIRYLLLQQSCVVAACLCGGTRDVALAVAAVCVVMVCLCCATHAAAGGNWTKSLMCDALVSDIRAIVL